MGKRAGTVYIFRKNGNNWVNTNILPEPVPHPWNRFGKNVKISGKILVVSSIRYINKHGRVGAVYVYEFAGNNILQKKIVSADGRNKDQFGRDVSIAGNRIIIGAPNHKNNETNQVSGASYIYKKVQDEWIQENKIIPADGKNLGEFGVAVAVI